MLNRLTHKIERASALVMTSIPLQFDWKCKECDLSFMGSLDYAKEKATENCPTLVERAQKERLM